MRSSKKVCVALRCRFWTRSGCRSRRSASRDLHSALPRKSCPRSPIICCNACAASPWTWATCQPVAARERLSRPEDQLSLCPCDTLSILLGVQQPSHSESPVFLLHSMMLPPRACAAFSGRILKRVPSGKPFGARKSRPYRPGFPGIPDVLGDVAQLVRALPCHGRGRGFEPRRPRHKPNNICGLWHFPRQ